ncbi:hypothetical protein ACFOEK_20030 [Litoribrevibacter euphylliae]|uniref:Flagellar hook-associated protein 2 C-terminal domain-containing protein n=1 Tax=Litoribrevibacter euphylliae TaxID=1834034 RepID=A0ABV7HLL0_9GAMM
MMDDYFGVFSRVSPYGSKSVLLDRRLLANDQQSLLNLSGAEREGILERFRSGNSSLNGVNTVGRMPARSQPDDALVQVTLTEIDINTLPSYFSNMADATYFPSEGIIVEKSTPYLSDHPDIHQQITMAEISNNLSKPDSESLENIASLSRQKNIQLSSMLEMSGVFETGITEANIHTKVEVGNYRGLDDPSRLKVIKGYTDFKAWDPKDHSGAQYISAPALELTLQTKEGNSIHLSVQVEERTNKDTYKGFSRELNVQFSASEELTQEEAMVIQEYTTTLDGLLNSFSKDHSVLATDLTELQQTLASNSDAIVQTHLSLKHEVGAIERNIDITFDNDIGFEVSVEEENMALQYKLDIARAVDVQKSQDGLDVLNSDYYGFAKFDGGMNSAQFYIPAIVDSIEHKYIPLNHYSRSYLV